LLALLRAFALVALATSVALFIDYVSVSPSFCAADSGCSAVRQSAGDVASVLPSLGVLAFALVYSLSLAKSETARKALTPIAYLGAVMGAGFLAYQLKIGRFCLLCVIVDTTAIAVGVIQLLRTRTKANGEDTPLLSTMAWVVLAMFALGVPYLWSRVKPAPGVPPGIAKLYVSGKINVVEFADFECPFCRQLHPTLKKLVAERPDKVNFVRLNMPLPRHPHALDAAKGSVCGEAQGKREEIADALFESEDLSPVSVQRIAVKLGLDMPRFKACVADPETLARIERERRILLDAGFQGLPATYVGDEMIVGSRGPADDELLFREAMDNAARGQGRGGVPAWAFALLVAVGVGATIRFGRPS
jgi:predicted DsbA family dithiol-disulfide isomerase